MFSMQNITGKNIQSIRKDRNLTQEGLAIHLQIYGLNHTRTTIAKIENGLRRVTDIELQIIAKALEVQVGAFFEDCSIANS